MPYAQPQSSFWFPDLFSLAHKLVDLYPEWSVAWFAVGCYYFAVGKHEMARNHFCKATQLDRWDFWHLERVDIVGWKLSYVLHCYFKRPLFPPLFIAYIIFRLNLMLAVLKKSELFHSCATAHSQLCFILCSLVCPLEHSEVELNVRFTVYLRSLVNVINVFLPEFWQSEIMTKI